MDSYSGPAGLWGTAALHAHVAGLPSAIHSSHCHLVSVLLVSLAWVDSEVILSFWGGLDGSDSIAQMRLGPPYLCSYEEESISHLSTQLGSGIGSCVTPSALRK